jgi:hypothetical protein
MPRSRNKSDRHRKESLTVSLIAYECTHRAVSLIVCTGNAKASDTEFNSLAAALGIKDKVSLNLVFIARSF